MFLGMGNPLLDIMAPVKNEFLQKYKLKANDAILYENEDVYSELEKDYKVEYMAGGSAMNAMRVSQGILGKEHSTAFFGCVGEDKTGRILEECARKAGVDVYYQKTKEYPTGRCAVLITGKDRSLVTKLGAAKHFTGDYLDLKWDAVKRAHFFYCEGFFLTVSPDSMLKVARHAAETEKIFAINLSAPFIAKDYSESLLEVMAYATVVFGNKAEVTAFAEKQGYDSKDFVEIAKKIASLPLSAKGKKRTVVFTQSSDPVVVVTGDEMQEFAVTKLPEDKIVDTNGAGDALVGGYMAKLVLGKELAECVKCGIWAATEVIQRSGCTMPEIKAPTRCWCF